MRIAVSICLALCAASTAAAAPGAKRLNCSPKPAIAAEYVVDANHLSARILHVQRRSLLPGSKLSAKTNRLYRVTFKLLKRNTMLGTGVHSLFAYVAWIPLAGAWCYRHGGSGP